MIDTKKNDVKMPSIEAVSHHRDDQIECYQFDLFVPEECAFFDGHFDDQPILPGVTQLHWVMKLMSLHADGFKQKSFSALPQVKFTKPVYPNERLILNVRVNLEKQNLNFEYCNQTHSFSVGKMSYI